MMTDAEDQAYEMGLNRAYPWRTLTASWLSAYKARRLAPCDLVDVLTRTQKIAIREIAADPHSQRYAKGRTVGMLRALETAGLVNPHYEHVWSDRYRKEIMIRTWTLTLRGRSVLACLGDEDGR